MADKKIQIRPSSTGYGDVLHPETTASQVKEEADKKIMTGDERTKLGTVATGAQVNVATNIAQGTRTTTTVPITSSTGTSATLGAATTSLAGVMTSADKTKLDGIVITAGTAAPSGGADGDIYLQYE
jgi:hypothetical protein